MNQHHVISKSSVPRPHQGAEIIGGGGRHRGSGGGPRNRCRHGTFPAAPNLRKRVLTMHNWSSQRRLLRYPGHAAPGPHLEGSAELLRPASELHLYWVSKGKSSIEDSVG